jgi:hypothetical protein
MMMNDAIFGSLSLSLSDFIFFAWHPGFQTLEELYYKTWLHR